MSSIENTRLKAFPQMALYDEMPAGRIVPYAMLAGPADLRSESLNTDCHGFRWTRSGDQVFTVEGMENVEEPYLLLGGSTAFGVGATSDDKTIASLLSSAMGSPWLNMGIRGGVSFQEYIHLARFIHLARRPRGIVFFSGINDIYVNLLHETHSFFDRRFEERDSALGFYRWERQAASILFSKLYLTDPERLVGLSPRQMLFYPFRRKRPEAPARKLTMEERLERLAGNVRRNFVLYASLGRQLKCRVLFVLQPFFPWTGKAPSPDEAGVFKFLAEQQAGSGWSEMYELLGQEKIRAMTLEIYREAAAKMEVDFLDSSADFREEGTLFVDSVHLTNEGNALAARMIQEEL